MQMIKFEYRHIQLADHYFKPELAMYLNSDFTETDCDLWETRVKNLIDLNVPTVFTFDQKSKYERQKKIIFGQMKAVPLDLELPETGLNPFRELFSSPNSNAINNLDQFQTNNAYILAFQGK
jgi:hypothetical protein